MLDYYIAGEVKPARILACKSSLSTTQRLESIAVPERRSNLQMEKLPRSQTDMKTQPIRHKMRA